MSCYSGVGLPQGLDIQELLLELHYLCLTSWLETGAACLLASCCRVMPLKGLLAPARKGHPLGPQETVHRLPVWSS